MTDVFVSYSRRDSLGLPPGTVASRISRGLVMLRRALEEEAQPAAGGDIDA
jgi:hypothetical protein